MSLVTVAGSLPEIAAPGKPFAHVELDLDVLGGSFDQLRKAPQRLFLFLWRATGFGKEEIRITDREIAEGCGRSLRWVQKALRMLLGHGQLLGQDPDAEAEPRIAKRFAKGPREVAGRIIRIVLNFARPAAEAKAAPGPKGKGKAKGDGQAAAPVPPPARPAPPSDPAEPPPAPGTFQKILASIIGARAGPAKPAKTEAEMIAEADRKKAAYHAAAARRKAEAERKAAGDGPDPKPRE